MNTGRQDKNKLVVFQNKSIRRILVDDEWFFSVIDVVAALTDSVNPGAYWRKLKQRLMREGSEVVTFCHDENPELAQDRMKELYEQKGYPKDWIDKRLRGIAIRQNLTDEWKERGITEDRDFAILTAEISKATFGMTPSAYKAYKGLESPTQNLRDHMNDLELIFTMLGERVTTELSRQEKPDTMTGHKSVARRGGKVAGNARKETEKELGHSIISSENYLPEEDLPGLTVEDKKK